ncbi:hypothetical protein JL107_04045 [Nakamurella flavida]|uniref:Uncharacterized protein n=1 Tax=Nakamurella flavida TaxID=363630 RepID=A0A938YGR1_9ACTN|nr:hypothetical protein [Nakamurella flavida]MBM9475612.1 hypothetical protein [Nakamurella flavida]MDP9778112.1 hypothetical protein [Nakamurella flavida]
MSEPVESPAPARRSAPRAGTWAKVGMVLFAVGLVAIVVIIVLFATGGRDLPVWLNVTAMLAPVGLGVGLVGVFREIRRPAREARAAAKA